MRYIRKPWVGLLAAVVLLGGGYFWYSQSGTEEATAQFAVVETVARGTVTTGIETTGTIVAAEKLDLDVYKQTQRIEAVNVINGGKVTKGQTILSFDKSDAYVDVQSSQVSVADKSLALKTTEETASDPSQTIRNLEKELADIVIDEAQLETDEVQALRTYLNANKKAVAVSDNAKDRTLPTLSGLYSKTAEGVYRITVYASAADSGYSYRVTGLESFSGEVIFGVAGPLGNGGLEIAFPASVRAGDIYEVSVPNVVAPEYVAAKETYEVAIANIKKEAAALAVSRANAEQELANAKREDTTVYRDLGVSKAEAELSQAQVALAKTYDVLQEQDIVAPFSGTVEGMENVVVGASPTRETNDSISLGTLISDEFLVNFSLGAVDVSKVRLGQQVLVSVTSFPDAPILNAVVTEISSLPENSESAQYELQALITLPEGSDFSLREGLLADVEIVQQAVENVVRVPRAAVTFSAGKATVNVIGDVTDEQEQSIAQMGIIRTEGAAVSSYPVTVETGLSGSYFIEITSGLSEGDRIIVTQTGGSSEAVVEQAGFGPPGEGRRTTTSGEASAGGPPN